jgi:CRISPR-associated exonuclease Cas4
VSAGALWYWQTRHREEVEMTEQLREDTLEIIEHVRQLLSSGSTPKAKYEKKCLSCSLYDLCNPRLLARDHSASYVNDLFDEEM